MGLDGLLLSAVSSAVLGLLKFASPKVRDAVPNVFWPIALLGLSYGGSHLCALVGAACSGNPLAWNPDQVNVFASAFCAILIREAVLHGQDILATLTAKLNASK